ncbi:MAG: hypothetical protein ACTSXK_11220, partial [Promethearchaeota archaeon]
MPATQSLSKTSSFKPIESFPDYNLVFRLSHFIQKYRINRGFEKIPFFGFKMLSIILGVKSAIKAHKQLSKTWKLLFPKRRDLYRHWTNLFIRYNIELWADTTFYLPLRNPINTDFFNQIEGFSNLEKAIQKKKGVLVPTIHLGEFYHSLFSLFYQKFQIDGKKQKILLAILSSKENDFLFREQLKPIKNLNVILTNDFKILKKNIEVHLRKNYTVFLLSDYYSENQLRVPFIYNSNKSDFLVPFPQMLNHFHTKLGTPIVPVISIPKHELKHSVVRFFPEISIHTMKISSETEILKQEIINFRNGILNKKQIYGLHSLLINRQLHPYILKYPFFWQVSFLFFKRTQFRIHLKDINSYWELLKIILIKLELFINKTYEPGRNDELIIQEIQRISIDLEEMGKDPNDKLLINNKYIELGRLNGKDAFTKVISILDNLQSESIRQNYKQISEKLNSIL